MLWWARLMFMSLCLPLWWASLMLMSLCLSLWCLASCSCHYAFLCDRIASCSWEYAFLCGGPASCSWKYTFLNSFYAFPYKMDCIFSGTVSQNKPLFPKIVFIEAFYHRNRGSPEYSRAATFSLWREWSPDWKCIVNMSNSVLRTPVPHTHENGKVSGKWKGFPLVLVWIWAVCAESISHNFLFRQPQSEITLLQKPLLISFPDFLFSNV